MQRTNVVELKPSKRQIKILREMMLLSSCVYNMANYEVRQSFFKEEKSPSFFDLQKKLQTKEDYQLLGRSYALPRVQIYGETNSARFKLIKSKSQKKVGLPKYLKNRNTNTTIPSYLVIDGCQYSLSKTKACLPLSRLMRKKYGLKDFKIDYNGVLKHKGKQQRGQIHFKDGKFYLYQSVEFSEPKQKSSGVVAGIDLGIKRLFAIKISNNEDVIIGSNRHFKQWNHYGDLIAQEQSRLALINRKSSRRLSKLFSIRSKWQENLYNNLVCKVFRFLNRNNVDTLFVGDVKGIREDNDIGCKGNKMLHNYWAYETLYHKLENKSEEFGIKMERHSEAFTSRTCPICGVEERSHKKDRLFVCSFCDYFDDRDVVGATNIMFIGMHDQNSVQSVHQAETSHLGGMLHGIES
jgi:putative transposase